MPNRPQDTDTESWHRYFAIECNNRAWALAVQDRTEAEDEELLSVAHASAYHWNVVGDELNRMRAKMLLAEAHALLGLGDSALAMAEIMRDYFLDRETPDWELAFVHTIHAHAAAVAGDVELHQVSYAEAERAIEAIGDPEDRRLVLETFNLVPGP